MALRGRKTLTEAPPLAASSSEDSDSGSDDSATSSDDKSPINSNNNNNNNSSSSSDDEAEDLTQPPQQPPKKPQQPPTKPHVPDSDSDSDSESDSDSDPKPPPSDHPKSKPASLPVSNKRKSGKAESSTPEKVKKQKTDPSGSTQAPDEGSKKLFQRFWSEDDEIVILKGLIEFKAEKGKDPMSDVDGFLDFIKTSLHVADVKKDQIVNKVRRLKGRFQNAKKRTPTNPHDLQAFELSKSIWGGLDDEKAKGPSNSKSKVSKVSNVKSGVKNVAVNGGVLVDGVSHGIQPKELTKFGNVDEKFIVEGLKLLGDDERGELEEEWFKFNVTQMEGLVSRLELYQRTAKAVLNALKSTTS